MPALFNPGRIVATAGALLALPPDTVTAALRRHLSGDWSRLYRGGRPPWKTCVLPGRFTAARPPRRPPSPAPRPGAAVPPP